MKVKYTEGPQALIVEGVGRVERGQAVEVDKKLGEQLLVQGWKRASGGGRKPASKKRAASKKAANTQAGPADQTPETGPNKES